MSRQTPVFLAAVCFAALATSAYAASDKAFLETALEGDNAEIALGQLAEQKGATPATKEFAQMLVTDHTDHRAKVLALAQTHDVADTQAMGAGARREEVKLNRLDGPAFDREFARFMTRDHMKAITAYRQEARTGDPAISAMAKQTLPTLHKHLSAAESLESTSAG